MNPALFPAIAALLPVSLGPLGESPPSISARLCLGGEIEIPVEREKQPDAPCPVKACHASSCRKRFDLTQ